MIRQTLITDFYKKPVFEWEFFKSIKQTLQSIIKNSITTNGHISTTQKQALITDYYSTFLNQQKIVDIQSQQKITKYFFQRS